VAELDADNQIVSTQYWGIDLSGSEQGAGGVGGLLAVDSQTSHFPAYDGNGNITAYTDSTDAVVYSCFYTPFGKVIDENGTKPSPYGFSTKPLDPETGLVYYIYRDYSPELGRWISRDPVEEKGGLNVYVMLYNNTIDFTDILGLIFIPFSGEPRVNNELASWGDIDLVISFPDFKDNGKCCWKTGVLTVTIKMIQYVDQYTWKGKSFKRTKENIERTIRHERKHETHKKYVHDKWERRFSEFLNYTSPTTPEKNSQVCIMASKLFEKYIENATADFKESHPSNYFGGDKKYWVDPKTGEEVPSGQTY
jgi:RHS repeat-associated protein